jgi:hypothetical protein
LKYKIDDSVINATGIAHFEPHRPLFFLGKISGPSGERQRRNVLFNMQRCNHTAHDSFRESFPFEGACVLGFDAV